MADHTTELRTVCNAENPQTDSAQVSKCYRVLLSFIPIPLIVTCLGVVILLAGVTSLIAFGVGRERVMLACFGCFLVMFGMIFYVVVKIKVADMNPKPASSDNRELDLTTEVTTGNAADFMNLVFKTEVVPPCRDNPQPTPERPSPPCYEDVVPAGSAPQALSSTEQTSLLGNEIELCECELEILGEFQFPPSYEEATFGENYNLEQN